VSCFLPARAEGFEQALRDRGFVCEHYLYLSRPIATGADSAEAEPWNASDLLPAAALLRESYGVAGKHFAPRGTPEEWEQYIRSLVERPGCGVIEPAVTRVVRNGSNLEALVLATRIAPGTMHLPQVAVHPKRRRQGLAHRLVEEACRAAAVRGVKQATLLVAESNASARALYAKMGFADMSQFVAGTLMV
jgi:ribosomal protein S18 acetylase RimI-like enzyme